MRWGEDHMVMTALYQTVGLPVKPQVESEPVALGTGTMPAGVVPMSVVMMFGALLHVSAERGGPALHEGARGLADMQRQVVRALVRGEGFFEYRLNSVGIHKRIQGR